MRIGIIDDHEIFRDGLKMLLPKNEFTITLEASNGLDMIRKLKTITKPKFPEVFIVDVSMPKMDGFGTVNWLRSKYPDINIIVLSMRGDDDTVLRMIKLGVNSYLTKDVNADVLLNALRIVSGKKFYFPDNITRIIVNGYQQDTKLDNHIPKISDLSEREIQFLKLACTEKSYQEIAEDMGVSPRTVDGFRESLFSKLKVKTRVGLALMAVKIKVVSI